MAPKSPSGTNAFALNRLFIHVSINGPIISPSDQDRLLEKFVARNIFPYRSEVYGKTAHSATSLRQAFVRLMARFGKPMDDGRHAGIEDLFRLGRDAVEGEYVRAVEDVAARTQLERVEGYESDGEKDGKDGEDVESDGEGFEQPALDRSANEFDNDDSGDEDWRPKGGRGRGNRDSGRSRNRGRRSGKRDVSTTQREKKSSSASMSATKTPDMREASDARLSSASATQRSQPGRLASSHQSGGRRRPRIGTDPRLPSPQPQNAPLILSKTTSMSETSSAGLPKASSTQQWKEHPSINMLVAMTSRASESSAVSNDNTGKISEVNGANHHSKLYHTIRTDAFRQESTSDMIPEVSLSSSCKRKTSNGEPSAPPAKKPKGRLKPTHFSPSGASEKTSNTSTLRSIKVKDGGDKSEVEAEEAQQKLSHANALRALDSKIQTLVSEFFALNDKDPSKEAIYLDHENISAGLIGLNIHAFGTRKWTTVAAKLSQSEPSVRPDSVLCCLIAAFLVQHVFASEAPCLETVFSLGDHTDFKRYVVPLLQHQNVDVHALLYKAANKQLEDMSFVENNVTPLASELTEGLLYTVKDFLRPYLRLQNVRADGTPDWKQSMRKSLMSVCEAVLILQGRMYLDSCQYKCLWYSYGDRFQAENMRMETEGTSGKQVAFTVFPGIAREGNDEDGGVDRVLSRAVVAVLGGAA